MAPSWKPSKRTSGRFRSIEVVDETGSTNQDLAHRATAGEAAGAVLVARHQTAGRGRQGRTWFDQPDSSLLMSWTVDIEAPLAPLLSLVTGVAVCRAVEVIVGQDVARLKWPNDVQIPSHGDRKLTGILAEAVNLGSQRIDGSNSLRVVMGMGTNIDLSLDSAPPDVVDRAVDLQTLVGGPVDRAAFLDALLDACDTEVDRLERSSGAALDGYRALCSTIGREVRFETSNGVIEGRAVGVGAGGSLVVETDDGVQHDLTAGDAHHVRPAPPPQDRSDRS